MKRLAAILALGLAGAAGLFGAGLVSSSGATTPTTTTTTTGGHTPVTICHKPGTPAEGTIVVDDSAVLAAHLAHGDTLGACPDTTTTTTTTTAPPPPCTPGGDQYGCETTTDETITTTEPPPPPPPGDRCPPGMVPTDGKDGEPGNDECEYPPTGTTTSSTTTEPPATTPTTTEPPPTTIGEPPVATEPDVTTTVSDNPPTITFVEPKPKPAPDDATPASSSSDDGTLPHTGLSLLAALGLGLGLTTAGLILLRRRSST